MRPTGPEPHEDLNKYFDTKNGVDHGESSEHLGLVMPASEKTMLSPHVTAVDSPQI